MNSVEWIEIKKVTEFKLMIEIFNWAAFQLFIESYMITYLISELSLRFCLQVQ